MINPQSKIPDVYIMPSIQKILLEATLKEKLYLFAFMHLLVQAEFSLDPDYYRTPVNKCFKSYKGHPHLPDNFPAQQSLEIHDLL